MNDNTFITIVIACISSSALFTFITFLITRHDNKKGILADISTKLEKIEHQLPKIEKDCCRAQLLILMNHYKNDKKEILTLAEHYFADLEGDFYMTSLFCKWLKKNAIEKPRWFDETK